MVSTPPSGKVSPEELARKYRCVLDPEDKVMVKGLDKELELVGVWLTDFGYDFIYEVKGLLLVLKCFRRS